MPKRTELMMGNIAVSEGAIAAGCRFFAGYPLTPSNEISEYLSRRLPEVGGFLSRWKMKLLPLLRSSGLPGVG